MNKSISFFLGLLLGILICVLLFYFDVRLFESTCPQCNEKETITIVTTDTVYVKPPLKPKKTMVEDKIQGSADMETPDEHLESEVSIYESDFSFEGREQDEVFSDQLLQTKTVKVKFLASANQDGKQPDNFFQFFEIQMWSTPIKNKVTYYRDNNMLKIKGMKIDNMNVVFWNNLYYLEIANRHYAIPETKSFETLNIVQIPQ
ncbi:MAG: hypothetical protein FWC10_06580 [Lentimicrobiaceae bacterium]|nr:hypothetical protein [Lentimicrobiaceae bacterium]